MYAVHDPVRPEIAWCPVARFERLHAHDASTVRCVNELIRADRDRDVRRVMPFSCKEKQISRLDVLVLDLLRGAILRSNVARNGYAVSCVHVVHEPAAIEALLRIGATETVRGTSEQKRRTGDDIAIKSGIRGEGPAFARRPIWRASARPRRSFSVGGFGIRAGSVRIRDGGIGIGGGGVRSRRFPR